MSNFVSTVLQAILEASLPIIAVSAAGWMVEKFIEMMRKLKSKNQVLYEVCIDVSRTAVNAAEQMFSKGENQQKKEYAMNVAEKCLAAKGIRIDLDIIEACIESAVRNMKSDDFFTSQYHELFNENKEGSPKKEDIVLLNEAEEVPQAPKHICENGVCRIVKE